MLEISILETGIESGKQPSSDLYVLRQISYKHSLQNLPLVSPFSPSYPLLSLPRQGNTEVLLLQSLFC